jgi:hypothetical protein
MAASRHGTCISGTLNIGDESAPVNEGLCLVEVDRCPALAARLAMGGDPAVVPGAASA